MEEKFKSELMVPGSQFALVTLAKTKLKEIVKEISVKMENGEIKKFFNVKIPFARMWNSSSSEDLLWYLNPNKTFYKESELGQEIISELVISQFPNSRKISRVQGKNRDNITNSEPFNDTKMLLSQRMAGESTKKARLGALVNRTFSRSDGSEAVVYLPGRRLLEKYFDKYPFNKYYKTNPITSNFDLYWTGNPMHGVWIDPRGQDQISLTMTPSNKLLDPKSDIYSGAAVQRFNHYQKIDDELKEYEDKLMTCWRGRDGCLDWNLNKNKDLVAATPFIDLDKGMFTLTFDYNDLRQVSQLGKEIIDKSPLTGYYNFQLGPIINSHRSYIDSTEKYAIIFFYDFVCDLMPYHRQGSGVQKGKLHDIFRN